MEIDMIVAVVWLMQVLNISIMLVCHHLLFKQEFRSLQLFAELHEVEL